MLQAKIWYHREQVDVQSVHDSGNPQFQPQRHRDLQLRLYQLIRKSWRDFETLWWVLVAFRRLGNCPLRLSPWCTRDSQRFILYIIPLSQILSTRCLHWICMALNWPESYFCCCEIKFSKSSPALRFSENLLLHRYEGRERKKNTHDEKGNSAENPLLLRSIH